MLSLEVSDATMIKRLLHRGKTSGRVDDNEETIQRRLDTFHSQTQPVIDHYEKEHKVKHIEAEGSPDDVFEKVKKILHEFEHGILNT